MATTIKILETLSEKPLNPGEISSKTGLPRYEVLAAIHVLEELGFIKRIYSRGTHRVYVLTSLGAKLLEAYKNGAPLLEVVNRREAEAEA